MCILQQVRYSIAEYKFIIECDVCIGKISVFINHGILTSKMTVLQNDADVSWYVYSLAYNAAEISSLLVSTMVLARLFSKLIMKKSLQMLCESRHKNLKILIAPLNINIKLSSLKSTGTVSTVVQGFHSLYFITKINGHIL